MANTAGRPFSPRCRVRSPTGCVSRGSICVTFRQRPSAGDSRFRVAWGAREGTMRERDILHPDRVVAHGGTCPSQTGVCVLTCAPAGSPGPAPADWARAPGAAGGGVPGGSAPLPPAPQTSLPRPGPASRSDCRRSWTRSRTPRSMCPRRRRTWICCTTPWTWRTPVTAAPTWRTTTASSAPRSPSSGGGVPGCRGPVWASRPALSEGDAQKHESGAPPQEAGTGRDQAHPGCPAAGGHQRVQGHGTSVWRGREPWKWLGVPVPGTRPQGEDGSPEERPQGLGAGLLSPLGPVSPSALRVAVCLGGMFDLVS